MYFFINKIKLKSLLLNFKTPIICKFPFYWYVKSNYSTKICFDEQQSLFKILNVLAKNLLTPTISPCTINHFEIFRIGSKLFNGWKDLNKLTLFIQNLWKLEQPCNILQLRKLINVFAHKFLRKLFFCNPKIRNMMNLIF